MLNLIMQFTQRWASIIEKDKEQTKDPVLCWRYLRAMHEDKVFVKIKPFTCWSKYRTIQSFRLAT